MSADKSNQIAAKMVVLVNALDAFTQLPSVKKNRKTLARAEMLFSYAVEVALEMESLFDDQAAVVTQIHSLQGGSSE